MIINDENKSFKDLLDFPCNITFSVISSTEEGSEQLIRKVIEEDNKLKIKTPITAKKSAKGNYISYRVTTKVESEDMLKKLYADLGKIPGVRYVL